MTDRRRLLTIFLVVFVDLLGFGLILPLLPFYAEQFGASEAVIGLLVASYPAMQMIGTPLLGGLSDRYGRRPLLLVSVFGTMVGYILLGLANGLVLLFLSRMLDGLTGGNISVAQAYIADVTEARDRARGLGLIGAAFGLGFILGPALGGLLSVYGFAVPAYAAAFLALLNLVAIALWLPESLSPEQRLANARQELGTGAGGRQLLSPAGMAGALRRPRVGPLLTVRLGFALAFNTFQTIFPLYALVRFDLNARETGFFLAYVGVLVVLVQGGAIGPVTRRFDETRLIVVSSALTGAALLGWALTPSLLFLAAMMIPMAVGVGFFNAVLNSALSNSVYNEEVGSALGLSASLESVTRVISPTASGFLLGSLGPAAPGLVGTAIMALVVPYAYRRLIKRPDPPLPIRAPMSVTIQD